MERRILYNLVYLTKDLEMQKKSIKELKKISKDVIDKDSYEMILIIDEMTSSNILVTPKGLNTYFTFNNSSTNLDDYFWELDETSDLSLDLEIAITSFIKEKEIEENEKRHQEALEIYKRTGNVQVLKSLRYEDYKEKDIILPIEKTVDLALENLRKIKDKEDIGTINFSNAFFNTQIITKGIESHEFVVLAARPGVGKTAFTLALINDLTKQGKNVLFLTLEMNSTEVIKRMLTAKTGISNHIINSRSKFTQEKYDSLVIAGEELKKQQINIIDEVPRTFIEIKDIITKEHEKKPIDIVFVDYLSLIESYDGNSDFNKTETVSKISRGFKLLAKELEVPMFVLQQTSRAAAQGHRGNTGFKPLQLTDLRDSGALEQDADKVFLLWNKEPETEEEEQEIRDSQYKLILSIAKNRNGQADQKVLLAFNRTIQRIREISWLTKPSGWSDEND